MEGILGSRSRMLQLQLFDAANPDSPLLAGRAQVSADAKFQRIRNIYMYGRSWQLQVASTPEYEAVLRTIIGPSAGGSSHARLCSRCWSAVTCICANVRCAAAGAQPAAAGREARFRQLIEQLPWRRCCATQWAHRAGQSECRAAARQHGRTVGRRTGESLRAGRARRADPATVARNQSARVAGPARRWSADPWRSA